MQLHNLYSFGVVAVTATRRSSPFRMLIVVEVVELLVWYHCGHWVDVKGNMYQIILIGCQEQCGGFRVRDRNSHSKLAS